MKISDFEPGLRKVRKEVAGGGEEMVGAEAGPVETGAYLHALQLCNEYQSGDEEESIGEGFFSVLKESIVKDIEIGTLSAVSV